MKKRYLVSTFLIILSVILFSSYVYAADCDVDEDCAGIYDQACVVGSCVNTCGDDAYCPGNAVCIDGLCLYDYVGLYECADERFSYWNGVCAPECVDDESCPDGFSCSGGMCISGCTADDDCIGSKCAAGMCVPSCEVKDDCPGMGPGEPDCIGGGCIAQKYELGMDCGFGFSDWRSWCLLECSEDEDCLGEAQCLQGKCLPSCSGAEDYSCSGILCGRACVNNVSVPSCTDIGERCPSGTLCLHGECTFLCDESEECPEGSYCAENLCLSACEDDSDCSRDSLIGGDLRCREVDNDDVCWPSCDEDSDCPVGLCNLAESGGICDPSLVLFKTSKGHAQIAGSPIYTESVGFPDGANLSNSCKGNADIVLTLSDDTNAHVSKDTYDKAVCLHSDIARPRVRCRISESDCAAGTKELVRISNYTNAHVLPSVSSTLLAEYFTLSYASMGLTEADWSEYIQDYILNKWLHVCCSVPQDGDGDGYADVDNGGDDCNDEDANINPEAPELPSNGRDDNCNGLTDENRDNDNDGFYNDYDACPSESLSTMSGGYSYVRNDSGCALSIANNNLPGWSASGATAFVVTDPTAQSSDADSYRSLKVSGSGYVEYGVSLKGATQYTVAFWYKVESGSLSFRIDGSELLPEVSLNDHTWKRFTRTFTTPGSIEDTVNARLRWSGSSSKFYLDSLQLEAAPEPTRFNSFLTADVGCCPFDFCWTGGVIPEHPSCIHSKFYEKNVSMPPIGWNIADFGGNTEQLSTFLDAPNGYRCINGSWKFARAKPTPLFDKAGYCLDDTQCFIGGDADAAIACVDSGEVRQYSGGAVENEWFYCHDGNWTTRTKEIALQMLRMANSSDSNRYTIFCDKFDRSLNPDETLSYYRDFVGDNIVTLLTAGFVEEFCVMDLNGQVIAGVSLVNDINQTLAVSEEGGCFPGGFQCLTEGNCDDAGCLNPELVPPEVLPQKSFIEMLKGSEDTGKDYCDLAITNLDGQYHVCSSNDVYYNAKLKSVIFTRTTQSIQAVPFETTTTLIGEIWDYLKQLFRDLLGIAGLAQPSTELVQAEQLGFIQKAGSFDKLYLSYNPDGPDGNPRTMRAIRETRAQKRFDAGVDFKTFISAEYRNYQVDICRFFFTHNYHEIRAQISDFDKADNIQCQPVIINESTNEWMHSIYVEEPVFEDIDADLAAVRIWKGASDSFWNDITAKVRTQPPKSLPDEESSAPGFTTMPENPVVGTPITFSAGLPEGAGIIASTWHFGDGEMASSAYNITAKHVFKDASTFDVQLCVMNSNYRIACSAPTPITVGLGPGVDMQVMPQLAAREVRIEFVITGGNANFSLHIDWNDTRADERVEEFLNHSERSFVLQHEYDVSQFGVGDFIEKAIKIVGVDRDGVPFDNAAGVPVSKNAP